MGIYRIGDRTTINGDEFELAAPGSSRRLAEQRSWARWMAVAFFVAALIVGPNLISAGGLAVVAGFLFANRLAQDELKG